MARPKKDTASKQMSLGEKVPEPVVPPEKDFLEYPGPDGEKWRVECWRALKAKFALTGGEEMYALHAAFSGNAAADRGRGTRANPPSQELRRTGDEDEGSGEARAWRMLRLLYGIAPLLGETEVAYLQPHDHFEVEALLGLEPGRLDDELTAAISYWRRFRMSGTTKEETEERMPESAGSVIPVDTVKRLLRENNLDDLTDEADRHYAAQRLLDLNQKLEDAQGRPLAIRAIRMELQLQMYDRLIADLKVEYDRADVKTKGGLRDEMMKLGRSQSALNSEYNSTMEKLEATHAQNPGIKQKVAFTDCVSFLVEAVREYEARGDRRLVDGVFRAAEIEILVKPTTLRAPQYRPDLVAVINDSMKEENLFNPTYAPPEMPRAAYRRFRKAFNSAIAAVEDDETVMDLEEDGDEEIGQAAPAAEVTAPVAENGTAADLPVQAPMMSAGDDVDF